MAINTDMVGQTFGPFVRDYTFRDLELFALGCGAGIDGKNGLEYLNEHDERDPKLKVLPMFGAMLIVDSEVTRTIDYGYNYAGSLHWGFDIRFHRPIVKMSDRLETKVKLEGLYDRGEGRGLLAQHIGDTYDSEGNLLFTNESWDCLIYDGGWGGPKPPKDIVEMPDRPADVETTETIPENQALIDAAIENLCEGKTVLIVAHRLDVVPSCDAVAVVEDGHLTSVGSHRETLERSPYYRGAWDAYQRSRSMSYRVGAADSGPDASGNDDAGIDGTAADDEKGGPSHV